MENIMNFEKRRGEFQLIGHSSSFGKNFERTDESGSWFARVLAPDFGTQMDGQDGEIKLQKWTV